MSNPSFNRAYTSKRSDIVKLVPPTTKSLLDVGCSTGALGAQIKTLTGAQVIGIELSESMAAEASNKIDKTLVGDATNILSSCILDEYVFDTIIFADILEHLVDPWSTLKCAIKHLDRDGVVILSIPNIRHISTICNLIFKGYWPYKDRGIHDKTHLRFFTRKNILELIENADLRVEAIKVNYRFFDEINNLNRYAKYFAFPILRNFLAYQYIVIAKKK